MQLEHTFHRGITRSTQTTNNMSTIKNTTLKKESYALPHYNDPREFVKGGQGYLC